LRSGDLRSDERRAADRHGRREPGHRDGDWLRFPLDGRLPRRAHRDFRAAVRADSRDHEAGVVTRRALRGEQGAAVVEFALAGSIAIVLLLAITGLAHWLYTLEILAEATRAGARMAVVCDLNDSSIKAALQAKVPNLQL